MALSDHFIAFVDSMDDTSSLVDDPRTPDAIRAAGFADLVPKPREAVAGADVRRQAVEDFRAAAEKARADHA